jgi:glycosyltransferase involved in cell wall biosynthesis
MLNWRDPKNPLAGGAERVSLAYLAALVRRGHDADWFAYNFSGAAGEEFIDGVRIVRGGGMGTSILAARRWARRQPRYDLVIDQHHGIPWYAPHWCGTRCVAYIHEVLGPIWGAFYPWPLSWLGCFQERWTHWFYRRIPFFTGSEETRSLLRRHGVRDVSIVNYGTDVATLQNLPQKPLETPLRLIVVSRLAPNKRIDHGLETVVELLQRGISTRLTVIGGGEEDRRLKRLASELNIIDKVRFTGPLSEADKNAALQEAHFIIHTSQREGWGLNVTEANAMGTPGAVYPVGGLTESTLDERTGIVSRKESPSSLADRLVEALGRQEDYQSWRKAAWLRAGELHWDNILPRACDWLEARARGEQITLESR